MTLSIKIPAGLSKWTDLVGPDGRHDLFSVAANAVQILVRDHLSGEAMKRHFTARSLGATPTYILQKAARGTTFNATSEYGEVVIPISGIGRAFHDINLTTPTRNGKKFLTVPCDKDSYGHTVDWMRRRGWKIFRPGQAKILLGYKRKGDKPKKLFTLSEGHTLKKDPSLLPTQAEASQIVVRSIATECKRIIRNAH